MGSSDHRWGWRGALLKSRWDEENPEPALGGVVQVLLPRSGGKSVSQSLGGLREFFKDTAWFSAEEP